MPSKVIARALSKYHKSRKGRRPIRADNLLKKKTSSEAGQDLRLPITGGTKFPTADSKSLPTKLLNQSKSSAEVGPAPTYRQLSPTGPSVSQIAGVPKGVMPKLGADMTLAKDPLMQFLKKAVQVENNQEAFPTATLEAPITSEDSGMPPQIDTAARSEWGRYLAEKFKNKGSFRQKKHIEGDTGAAAALDTIIKKASAALVTRMKQGRR